MNHLHSYVADTRPEWPNSVLCAGCGFRAPKDDVLRYTMVLDRQLSPELLEARTALLAARRAFLAARIAATKNNVGALDVGR